MKFPNTELFWSVFSCIRTEYGDLRSPYSVRIQEIRTRKISVFKLFKQWMCLWVHNIEEVKSRYQNVQVWYRSKVHVRKTAWRNNSLAVGRSFSRSSKQRRVKSRIPGPRSAGIGGDSVALAIYNRQNKLTPY